ncbi:hypothetical protein JIG36_48740 [Actinoplanes sp. LDG1-06]|uniref:ParB/Spo0J HTH domain-containing protein n=1 Tax=Paractinoplanes ovalisporus TaxID=2810368 RepID=A0ABS2AUJ1_9ACTN|nr:hypothetical protein [Actinoplanes ovalisporus]MBM2623410.1 hypothetical protein [Actinoplanes ovalisporus]
MTAVVNETSESFPTNNLAELEVQHTTGSELALSEPVLIGEAVDGPVHLNSTQGEQPLPFRAAVLDARFLHEPQGFKRAKMGDLSDLIASVRLFGVRAPLVVRSIGLHTPTNAAGEPIEGAEPVEHFAVVKGLRRRMAAIAAERFDLPCFIADTDDEIQLILQTLELNDHHKDLEGLEKAEAYQMLLDLGLSDQQIADARRVDVSQIRTAVKARSLPAAAQRALNAGTLDLVQTHALEEFADDPDGQNKLLEKLSNPYDFKHELSRLRERRAYAHHKELVKAQLVLEGVEVTPKPRGFGYDGTAERADLLVDSDGQPVDIETVKTQPGFRAFVEKDSGGQAQAVVYCDDPAERGYARRKPVPTAYRGLNSEEIAARELEAQQTRERAERLRLAAKVRREFIVAMFGTAKSARSLFVPALRAAMLGKSMNYSGDLDELYRALGGSDDEVLDGAGEDRLRRSLVAKYICTSEDNLEDLARPHRMWVNEERAVAWYDKLRDLGYPLTADEQDLYESWTADDTEMEPDQDTDEAMPPIPDVQLQVHADDDQDIPDAG